MTWRRELGIADDEAMLLFVGRLVKEKAIDVVAALHDELKRRGTRYRMLVVGDGPARPQFEECVPEGIFTGTAERVPVGHGKTHVFFHGFSGNHPGFIVEFEGQRIVRLPSFELDLPDAREVLLVT